MSKNNNSKDLTNARRNCSPSLGLWLTTTWSQTSHTRSQIPNTCPKIPTVRISRALTRTPSKPGLVFLLLSALVLALLSMMLDLREDLVKRHLRVTIPQDPFLNLPMTWGGLKRTPTRNDLKQCSGRASGVDVMWLQPSGDATIPHCVQLGSWRQCNADLTQFWDFRQLECNFSLGKESVWLTVRADLKTRRNH